MNLPIIQRQILTILDDGPQTDKVIAGKMRTTLHGARASLNALRMKGIVRRKKLPDGATFLYEVAA